ncbi:ATP-dependent nuclease [Lactobacillus taiwanensis]|uniref:ATP-dependent nuclease n=1 Tax=Lactobacillus taiwanensis TaxID=508451 RepID=UPI0025AA06BC|nr:AAA family ATPase [Lactobacillus taiwanensis]
MRLRTLNIEGFRSFGEKTKIDFSKETVFIGGNGSGKTTALVALSKLFSPNSSDRIIEKSDFYVDSTDTADSEKHFYIEAVFELDNALNESDDKANAEYWSKLLITDGQSKPILKVRLEATWTAQGGIDGTVDWNTYFNESPDESKIDDKDKILAKRSQLSSIQFIYIPASRNPERQLSSASEGLISKLIREVNWNRETKEKINQISKELNEAFWNEKGSKSIQECISKEWADLGAGSRFSQAKASVSSIDLDRLIRRIQFEFRSNVTDNVFTVDEMSDGVKSLFYISNMVSILKLEQGLATEDNPILNVEKPMLTIFALEEPENHISPNLLGKVINKIKELNHLINVQTVLTSHSPSIVKRVAPENIRFFHLKSKKLKIVSEVNNISLPVGEDERYKFVSRAVQVFPELYFSKLVILGEGESEKIILSRLISIYPELNENEISIVPLAGRMVTSIWDLLESLNIKYITLLDLDYGRYLGGEVRIKYIIEELRLRNKESEKLNKIGEELNALNDTNKEKLIELTIQLQDYGVFFSSPLDVDFMMLQSYKKQYISITNSKPRTNEKSKILDRALKGKRMEKPDYSDDEIELMKYYNTIFLGRGKPVNHFLVLQSIEDKDLKDELPIQLNNLIEYAKKQLNIEVEDKKNDQK